MRCRMGLRLGALALGAACLAGRATAQDAGGMLPEPELQVIRDVVAAMRAADGAALVERVDFPRRFDELLQRGHGRHVWADLDETDQLLERQLLARAWTLPEAAWMRDTALVAAVEVDDPDAGLGPVPDRRILQAVVRNQLDGEVRDLLLMLTPELQLLDLRFGEPYFVGANPDGESGLLPVAEFSRADRPVVSWPDGVLAIEREDTQGLVTRLLAARIGPERNLAIERLHRAPHPGVAALIERLDQLDREESPDAEALSILALALGRITGRSAGVTAVARPGLPEPAWREGNRRSVLAWLAWHERHGASFAAAPIVDPIEPTMGENRERKPPLPMTRWEEKLAEGAIIREGAGSGGAASSGSSGAAPAGRDGDSAGGAAPRGTDGGGANSPPPPPPPPVTPRVTLPPPTGALGPRDLLFPAAADFSFRFGERDVTGREVEDRLTPSLKEALNAWAEPARRLGLRVVMSGNPEALVVGAVPVETLVEAAAWMDETWTLLDPLVPVSHGRAPRAIVAVIFDEQGTRSPAWNGVLDDLVARKLVFESAAQGLRALPSGLMLRNAGVFLQTTYDVAGNAAAGDDEFRLRNEVHHKYAQCLVTGRSGQLPPVILWGLGELAELHFTRSVYMFNTSGFVASADHFDWAQRTKQMLEKRGKRRGAALSADAQDDQAAGQAVEAQMVVWAALGCLAATQPATLRDLLQQLADLHEEADPRARATLYRGDADKTAALLTARLDALEPAEIIRWLDTQR